MIMLLFIKQTPAYVPPTTTLFAVARAPRLRKSGMHQPLASPAVAATMGTASHPVRALGAFSATTPDTL
jgi:hypothetical protein